VADALEKIIFLKTHLLSEGFLSRPWNRFKSEVCAVDAMLVGYERYAGPLTIQCAREALSRSGGVAKYETLFERGAGAGALSLQGAKARTKNLAADISPAVVSLLSEW
jgi:hypothetical protein